MKLKQKIYLAHLILFCVMSLEVNAQKIENVRFEQSGKIVNIYYDLSGESGQSYLVRVYCSTDGGTNYGNPLLKVTGDIGEKVPPGTGKRIIWDVLAEREKLTGDIVFMVTALKPGFTVNNGTFTDTRDGKTYKWVRIGTQIWMAENLNVGTRINGSQDQTNNSKIEKYCYNDGESSCNIYGGLYQWDEMMQYVTTAGTRGICPEGWHIPTDGEWGVMVSYLGGSIVAGGKMKETGIIHWNLPNTGASNSSGFTGLPGGLRYYSSGSFNYLGLFGRFWSSSQNDASNAYSRYLYRSDDEVFKYYIYKTSGFSVRCLKD